MKRFSADMRKQRSWQPHKALQSLTAGEAEAAGLMLICSLPHEW